MQELNSRKNFAKSIAMHDIVAVEVLYPPPHLIFIFYEWFERKRFRVKKKTNIFSTQVSFSEIFAIPEDISEMVSY